MPQLRSVCSLGLHRISESKVGYLMDLETSTRLAAVMVARRDAVLEKWTERVRETTRGRLTKTELTRQFEDIYDALAGAFGASASTTDSPAATEVLALVAELSRSRARHGFTATE